MVVSGSSLVRVVSGLLLLLLVVVSVGAMDADDGLLNWTAKQRQCSGSIGECFDEEEEEMLMDSESNRRSLWWRRSYISYGALSRDRVPCRRRGVSYYNCRRGKQANPYTRGCSRITRCARDTGWNELIVLRQIRTWLGHFTITISPLFLLATTPVLVLFSCDDLFFYFILYNKFFLIIEVKMKDCYHWNCVWTLLLEMVKKFPVWCRLWLVVQMMLAIIRWMEVQIPRGKIT